MAGNRKRSAPARRPARTMRSAAAAAFAFAALMAGMAPVIAETDEPAAKPESQEVRFAWALLAQVGGENGPQTVRVDTDTELHSGDGLRLLVAQRGPGHVYVVHRGS